MCFGHKAQTIKHLPLKNESRSKKDQKDFLKKTQGQSYYRSQECSPFLNNRLLSFQAVVSQHHLSDFWGLQFSHLRFSLVSDNNNNVLWQWVCLRCMLKATLVLETHHPQHPYSNTVPVTGFLVCVSLTLSSRLKIYQLRTRRNH